MNTAYSGNSTRPLTMDDLSRTMLEFRAKHGSPLKAIRVSDDTLRWMERNFPVYPSQTANALYGVPIQIDNDLELFDCKPVYA